MSRITTLLALTILSISFSYGQINRKLKKQGAIIKTKHLVFKTKWMAPLCLRPGEKEKTKLKP